MTPILERTLRSAPLRGGQLGADLKAAPAGDKAAIARLSRDPWFNAQMRTTCVATMLSGDPEMLKIIDAGMTSEPEASATGISSFYFPPSSFPPAAKFNSSNLANNSSSDIPASHPYAANTASSSRR